MNRETRMHAFQLNFPNPAEGKQQARARSTYPGASPVPLVVRAGLVEDLHFWRLSKAVARWRGDDEI